MIYRNFALIRFLLTIVFSFIIGTPCMALPQGFVYLDEIDPSIAQDMKYFTHDNFIGRPITGYLAPRCILTRPAAIALQAIQRSLKPQGLGLKVYDCYRPQMAVDDFIAWSKDVADQKMKTEFYPHVNKADFFKLGYVAAKSSHTRGSTVDLTIVHLTHDGFSPIELDMGTHFDYMDELSHPLNPSVPEIARNNRLLLRRLMQQAGFSPWYTEWWHFTLQNEPYPDTYFNFPVE